MEPNKRSQRTLPVLLVCPVLVLVGMLGFGSAAEVPKEESPGPSLKPTRYLALPFDPTAVKGLSEAGLSAKARDLLVKNGFVVVGPSRGDISHCYEGEFPPLVTLDCVLEIFLADFEIAWGELEDRQALSLAALQAELWDALVARFDRLPKAARGAGTRLLGLIAVGRSLADPKWKIPDKVPEGADAALRAAWQSDLDAVLRGAGGGRSALWKREIDWAVFKPVGVYDASPERRQFYCLSQWWGFQGLRAADREERLCAGILVWVLHDSSKPTGAIEHDGERLFWEGPVRYWRPREGPLGRLQRIDAVYDPFFGKPADVSPHDLLLSDHAGLPGSLGTDALDRRIRETFAYADLDPLPDAFRDWDMSDREKAGRNLRLLPPRSTFDSRVFGRVLTLLERWLPRGLDLLAAYGNDRARELTLAAEPEPGRKRLETQLLDLRGSFAKEEDDSSLWGFQGSLRRLVCELARPRPDPRAPLFVHTPAYRDRCLACALATWAGTREVYAPRVAVYGGGGGIEEEPLPGLVDPNLDAWQRLVELCHATEVAFQKAGVRFSPKSRHWALNYRRIAEKQLRGEALTRGERCEFLQFGNALRNAIDTRAAQTASDPMGTLDRRVAVAFARSRMPELVRYAGKACSPCWAIVEYGGRLQLCVGGVFDYVEFDLPPGKALPRAEFRELMDSPNAPPLPDWTKGYRAGR